MALMPIPYITLNQLPHFTKLDQSWFDRLSTKLKDNWAYSALNAEEITLLESARQVMASNETSEHRNSRFNPGEFINQLQALLNHRREAQDKVDVEKALRVLTAFAAYCEWAKTFEEKHYSLDTVIPYWISAEDRTHKGPGAVRLTVTLSTPNFRHQGECAWDAASITIWELPVTKPWQQHEQVDWKNHVNVESEDYNRLGLVRLIAHPLKAKVAACIDQERLQTFPPVNAVSSKEIRVSQPTIKDLRRILNDLAVLTYPHLHCPDRKHHLQFTVADDLSTIEVDHFNTDDFVPLGTAPAEP